MFTSGRLLTGLLVVAAWLSATLAAAQTTAPRAGVISVFSQKVGVRAYAGRAFRYSVRARVDTTQAGRADARLSAAAFDAQRKFRGFFLLKNGPIRRAQWETYTVAGRLPAQADSLLLSGLCYLNGTFEFDDFRLEVQGPAGRWLDVPLSNADFERSPTAIGLPAGWRQFQQTAGFEYAVVEAAPGQRVLRVQGRGIVPYGQNHRAGHYVVVNGVKLYYETYGQGEPLLLLHGNGESIGSFTQQIAALAAHYRVIAVDTRGHGQSGDARRAYTYDLFADDMRALLDTLRLPAAHVLGWSDGGNTGLSLALRYPSRVKSLVTMGANLYADRTSVEKHMLREVRQMRLLSTLLAPFSAQFRRARRLSTLLVKYPQLKPAQLSAITAPVLLLAGEKDIILEAHTQLIGQSIAGARVTILPGLTHFAPQENPALFNAAVLDFLQGLSGPAKAAE